MHMKATNGETLTEAQITFLHNFDYVLPPKNGRPQYVHVSDESRTRLLCPKANASAPLTYRPGKVHTCPLCSAKLENGTPTVGLANGNREVRWDQ